MTSTIAKYIQHFSYFLELHLEALFILSLQQHITKSLCQNLNVASYSLLLSLREIFLSPMNSAILSITLSTETSLSSVSCIAYSTWKSHNFNRLKQGESITPLCLTIKADMSTRPFSAVKIIQSSFQTKTPRSS